MSKQTDKSLPKRLQPALKALEKDLLDRAKLPEVEAGLKAAWEADKKGGETGQSFDLWRRARVTQVAAAWVLSVVFVRTLEDRGLIDPRIAGPDRISLRSARDREGAFGQFAPFLGPREYLLAVFRELSHLPGAREVFDAQHNPIWTLTPSSDGARALLGFFQQVDETTGAPVFTFPGSDTRFLGDLYQDLSEAVRKRYALLQTPDFVEKFILEQTLTPAIEAFGLAEVKLIDPTCGSGHFLLGAFRDLLAAWRTAEPETPIGDLAQRALNQVYGVDINPYAVAIARFRLVLALLEAVGITRLDQSPVLRPHVVVADSLLHRLMEQQLRDFHQLSMEEWASWGDAIFRLAEPRAVSEILGQRYHAVVGNPPYITEKDATKRGIYRKMYESASGKYALAAPFTERFFDLAVDGGFVGMINSNAWTKRDYGKALLEKVLPRFDLQKIIDTSGCYLPGHGTPTLLLFGRRSTPETENIVGVLGTRGVSSVPPIAADAPVWREIVLHHKDAGFDGKHVSTEQVSRAELGLHPWVMAGGGARPLLRHITKGCPYQLGSLIDFAGFMAIMGVDDAFVRTSHALKKLIPESAQVRWFATGTDIRDWQIEAGLLAAFFPYDLKTGLLPPEKLGVALRSLWPVRTTLFARPVFGGRTYAEAGRDYFEYHQIPLERISSANLIAYPFVSTHAHFVRTGPSHVFNKHAPIIRLKGDRDTPDYQALLGYLNSSTVGLWCRLVLFPKGGDQVGDGARISKIPWQDRLEYAGNLLQQLPTPDFSVLREQLLELAVAAEEIVKTLTRHTAKQIVTTTLAETPALAALRDARTRGLAERIRLRGILISLQEEIDWRVYGILGLPTVTVSSLDAVRVSVEPNHRPFEVRLAREVDTDISASEWFRIHKREAPSDVGGPLADLYRQRLNLLDDPEQGRQLRLLETPETKRRWSPPDDGKAFQEALRTWLLERIEAAFQEQRTPELRTARQIALDLGRDAAVQAVHELLTEESGQDFVNLVSELIDAEGVPFLAGLRYAETGMEKRATWEETWRLQRLEDAGTLEPELKRLGHKAIPVPDKYGPKDFLRHHWSLRGKLDVPKERFVTIPNGNNEDDPTLLCGWAGWNHLQVSQALASLYQRRKDEDAWTNEQLVPLLAGLAERIPWLLQWHNDPNEDFGGMRLGDFFREFVAGEAHRLGVAVDFSVAMDALRSWTPSAAPKRRTLDPDEVYSALRRWQPEIDEDGEDDEDAEAPEGPTVAELVTEIGASKTLVDKALQTLLADGRIEKLDGRPARYMAIGEDA